MMDLHEFYKSHYFFELARKDQLTNAIAIPAGVLTLVGGAISIISNTLDYPLSLLEVVEAVILFLSSLSVLVSVFFLIKSYFNYGYGFIATPLEIMEYKKELEASDYSKDEIDLELEDYVNEEYVKYSSLNTKNNDEKSYYIHKANWAMIFSIVFIFIAGVPHTVKSAIDGDVTHKVLLIK